MPPKQGLRQRAPAAKASLESVKAHLASGSLSAAAVACRILHENQPTPETFKLYKLILTAQAQVAIDTRMQADFERTLKTLEALEPNVPDAMIERAGWLARWGLLPQALMTLPADAGDSVRQKLVGHAADRSIQLRSYVGLPDEHHDSCKTVILAFAKYERGEDDAARDFIQVIGLQSPFLEWKLLLRGLLAFAVNDNAKAIENFQRLAQDRLPARLAVPLRARIDPAFHDSLTPSKQSAASQQARKLLSTRSQSLVQELQKTIGQPISLTKAWPTIEAAWASLKPEKPELADRLGRCVYQAIVRQGHPNDLPRFRRLFGVPADDPDFFRLQANVFESQEQFVTAIDFWEKYERWLGTKPAGWNGDFLKRARAKVLSHLGGLCERAHKLDDDDVSDIYRMFYLKAHGSDVPKKPALHYYQKAVAADPTAIEPRRNLIKHLAKQQQHDAVITSAKDALEHFPEDSGILDAVAEALQSLRRAEEALPLRLKILAANPLDSRIRQSVINCVFVAVRQALARGEATEALALLESNADIIPESYAIQDNVLRVTIFRKLGRRDEAVTLLEGIVTIPGARLAAVFQFSVDAAIAKLKTAEKTAANKLLAGELKTAATIEEITVLLAAHIGYGANGFEYRGQKTFPKKIEALLEALLVPHLSEQQANSLAATLCMLNNLKFVFKLLDRLVAWYPKNARLMLIAARSMTLRRASWSMEQRMITILNEAKRMLTAGDDPEKNNLLAEIDMVIRQLDPFRSLGDIFDRFGG